MIEKEEDNSVELEDKEQPYISEENGEIEELDEVVIDNQLDDLNEV